MPNRIGPKEAHALLAEGYTYVDVRSEGEFENGHPPGAVNVPILHKGPFGSTPNVAFVEVFRRLFPPGAKVVVGCAGGVRSMKACGVLEDQGYEGLFELRTGWAGSRDGVGQLVEPGWPDSGLPVETGQPPGRSWASLKG